MSKIKRTLVAAVSAAALVVPATASAHSTYCGSPYRYVTTNAVGVSCGTARTVERYWDSHEILSRTVVVAGIRWTITVDRSAGWVWAYGQWLPRYATHFTAGSRSVEIDSLPYG